MMTAEQFYLKWANESFGLYPDRKPAEYSIHFAESYANHRLNEEAVRLESSLKLVRAEAAAQLAEKEREIAFLLPQRNKWAMLCQHFGVPEKETCVATITDKFVAAEQRLQEAQAEAANHSYDTIMTLRERLRQREAELEQLRTELRVTKLRALSAESLAGIADPKEVAEALALPSPPKEAKVAGENAGRE